MPFGLVFQLVLAFYFADFMNYLPSARNGTTDIEVLFKSLIVCLQSFEDLGN